MNEIQLKLEENGRGVFVIENGAERLAEMTVGISGGNMTVYHTQVSEKLRGQGVAAKLLAYMVEYARKNQLKVIALCSYVHAQFTRNENQYKDVWNRTWHA